MAKTKKGGISSAAYRYDGKLSLLQAAPLGLQHVLAMFVGNLTPLLIITASCGIVAGSALQITILQNAMFIAGLVTLIMLFPIWKMGGRVPIIMGTSSGFIGVSKSIAGMGLGYGAIMGASLIGGVFEGILGFFIKPLRKLFPSVVTGTVVLSIGLSLIAVGVNSFGGGAPSTVTVDLGAGKAVYTVLKSDFGSWQNLTIAGIVLLTILGFKHFGKGFWSSSSILFGIIVGYIVCIIFAAVLPHTYTAVIDSNLNPNIVEKAEITRTASWVINWQKVLDADWFAFPQMFPVALTFEWSAIIPMLIMFIVTAVETVGDVSGVTIGGMGREATDKELSGSVVCDGLGSSIASCFGVLPNTSFSQNVGLVTMTKIVNRRALTFGAVFLIICALFPKIGAILSIMPQAVLGGAAVMMFSSIVVSGIQLITKEPMTARSISIVSVALGVGYGVGANSALLSNFPTWIQNIFGGSGIVPAALVAVIMNIVLPKDWKGHRNEVPQEVEASLQQASEDGEIDLDHLPDVKPEDEVEESPLMAKITSSKPYVAVYNFRKKVGNAVDKAESSLVNAVTSPFKKHKDNDEQE